MDALAEAGRCAEALQAYQRLREILADELGSDPSPSLQRLYLQILASGSSRRTGGEPQVSNPPQAARTSGDPRPAGEFTINLLPPDPADFTGRKAQIADIARRLADNRNSVPVVTVSGPPGVGSSTLAVHVAHRLCQEFPDGVLYAQLGGAASKTGRVLESFLRVLAPEELQWPADPVAQTGLYRSLYAGRRRLVVLDDPADVIGVRDLIPTEPGNAVLIACRGRLTALPGAYNVELAMLPFDESLELVTKGIGCDRLRAEPEAATTPLSWPPVRIGAWRISTAAFSESTPTPVTGT
ncbi:MAG: hypothetical protein AUG49_07140 [Catenulispora sp. 13_1_20CM_3_70_7]|nr:MAG: hypothetical protein AUG49_07140 [Catenulispora sp. 13_1_20CM_3_70_7]